MTGVLQLTEQSNPTAQTFRVVQPGGSVITSIGIFFAKAPPVGYNLPIFIELRPVENGQPSSTHFIPGTKVKATAAQIRAVASTTFSQSTEYKFVLPEPAYIPENTEVAIVIYTNAPTGQYKIWVGTVGKHLSGSTTKLISQQLNSGVMYMSSNGTAWSADQMTDIAFKVYRAVFNTGANVAYMVAEGPPPKNLTENIYTEDLIEYPSDPLVFTAGSNQVRVIHPAHGFIVGDKVTLTCDSSGFSAGTVVNGVKGSSILGTRIIDSADAYGYSVTMDSAAAATVRGGGVGIFATEQYVVDALGVFMPSEVPPATGIWATGRFTTHKSFGGNQTPYITTEEYILDLDGPMMFREPFVVASDDQELDATKLNGADSLIIKVGLETDNKYTAPSINVDMASLSIASHFIDNQDSNNSILPNVNRMITVPYVSETTAKSGTTPAKHITIPYTLEVAATSIRVLIDAYRPTGSDFTVWYRTNNTSSTTPIQDKQWTAFSKTINPPNSSNYSQIGNTDAFRQFEFNVYDIPSFDQYQVKVTMNSTSSTAIPLFQNLRTIATA